VRYRPLFDLCPAGRGRCELCYGEYLRGRRRTRPTSAPGADVHIVWRCRQAGL